MWLVCNRHGGELKRLLDGVFAYLFCHHPAQILSFDWQQTFSCLTQRVVTLDSRARNDIDADQEIFLPVLLDSLPGLFILATGLTATSNR